MQLNQYAILLTAVYLLAACADQGMQAQHAIYAVNRAVHSGLKERVDFFYAIDPTCTTVGYPEVKIEMTPRSGKVYIESGENYPNFPKDNVRWDCNRKLVGSTQLFYQSHSDFHGKDSFEIKIRYPSSEIKVVKVLVEVL